VGIPERHHGVRGEPGEQHTGDGNPNHPRPGRKRHLRIALLIEQGEDGGQAQRHREEGESRIASTPSSSLLAARRVMGGSADRSPGRKDQVGSEEGVAGHDQAQRERAPERVRRGEHRTTKSPAP
jgi:hypothetical protein